MMEVEVVEANQNEEPSQPFAIFYLLLMAKREQVAN